jgi:hypothetical protein
MSKTAAHCVHTHYLQLVQRCHTFTAGLGNLEVDWVAHAKNSPRAVSTIMLKDVYSLNDNSAQHSLEDIQILGY